MKALPELIIEKYQYSKRVEVKKGVYIHSDCPVPGSVMLDVLYALRIEREYEKHYNHMLGILETENPETPVLAEMKYQLQCIEKKYNIKKEDYEEQKEN